VTAPLLAALAAGLAVFGAWEALAVVEQLRPARALGRVIVPLRLAGRAGRVPTAPERHRLAIVGAGTLLAAGWLLAGPPAGVLLAAAGPAAVGPVLAARRRRWRRALGDGASGVARALADALAGGHSIRGALQDLGRAGAVPGPAGAELRAAAHRLALGAPTDDVLTALRDRAGHPAWDTLVAAILLQREAGGDLASLLRSIAEAAEHARRVEADARGLTAQARFTALVVALLPLGAAVLAELGRPGYVASLLAQPLSAMLIATSLALQLLAWIAVRRIARLRA
jgi:tight adherence protein B